MIRRNIFSCAIFIIGCLWAMGCGDGAILVDGYEMGEEQGTLVEITGLAREQYIRTYLLLPQDVTAELAGAIVTNLWDLIISNQITVGVQEDDAAIGDLDVRRVIVLNPGSWGGDQAMKDFYQQNYPGIRYASLGISQQFSMITYRLEYQFEELSSTLAGLLETDSNFEVLGNPSAISQGRGIPVKEYDRYFVLLHKNMGPEWAWAVYQDGWKNRHFTLGTNLDDAGIGKLKFRRVMVVRPADWSFYLNGTLFSARSYLEKFYPYHEYLPAYVKSPEELTAYLYPRGEGIEVGEDEHWVEVDLTNQRLIAYIGREPQFDTIVRSGKGSTPTPTGFYFVDERYRYDDMGCVEGYNYCLRDVSYVQYFARGGYALHAATSTNAPDWNGLPGAPGNKWGIPGSHGCVNIPNPYAKMVYEHGYMGMFVYVHYSGGEDLYDSASYVADVTVADGTVMSPGQAFEKQWELKNTGNTVWSQKGQYTFKQVENETGCPGSNPELSSTKEIFLPEGVTVKPREKYIWSVPMAAPQLTGNYIYNCWQMHRDGIPFGDVVWVMIHVVE